MREVHGTIGSCAPRSQLCVCTMRQQVAEFSLAPDSDSNGEVIERLVHEIDAVGTTML